MRLECEPLIETEERSLRPKQKKFGKQKDDEARKSSTSKEAGNYKPRSSRSSHRTTHHHVIMSAVVSQKLSEVRDPLTV